MNALADDADRGGGQSGTTTYIVSDKNKENLFNNSGGTPTTPLTTPLTTPVTLTGPTSNTNFLFDANGNLTQVLDTPHVVFDHGNDVPGSSTQFATPTPLAHAKLTFGSGTTASTAAESYYDAGTGIRFGRWTGGTVNMTDLSTGTSYAESLVAPGGAPLSVQWVVAQMPSSLPLTGEFQYTRINGASGTPSFATAPTDSYGNVGTLEGARLSADFTNMTASAGVRISMPSGPAGSLGIQNLSSQFSNAPITNGGFNVSSGTDNPVGTDNLHVSCIGAGCAANQTYGGRIEAASTARPATPAPQTAHSSAIRSTRITAAPASPRPPAASSTTTSTAWLHSSRGRRLRFRRAPPIRPPPRPPRSWWSRIMDTTRFRQHLHQRPDLLGRSSIGRPGDGCGG